MRGDTARAHHAHYARALLRPDRLAVRHVRCAGLEQNSSSLWRKTLCTMNVVCAQNEHTVMGVLHNYN